jgi:RNA polymerase sigma factor (sigma-70 family)
VTAPDLGALAPLDEERDVIERLKQGDRVAAATLYQWYGDKLYRQAILPRLPNPELAQDVLKDTFKTALEKIQQFQFQDRSIFFWLRRIAINRAIDVHRANQRKWEIEKRVPAEYSMSQQPARPDMGPEAEETKVAVEKALGLINPRYAEALRLRLLEDEDRDVCAEKMGVTIGNFDVILHRACKAFRKVYPP